MRLYPGLLVVLVVLALATLVVERVFVDRGLRLEEVSYTGGGGRTTTILHWTTWFGVDTVPSYPVDVSFTCPRHADQPDGDKLKCRLTSDKSALHEAQALVFHSRDIELKKLPPKNPTQLWIYWSEENPLLDHRSCGWYYRFQWWAQQCDKVSLNRDRLALFNLRMGYQLDSEIITPYIRRPMKNYTDQPLMVPLANKKNAIVWIANNCDSLNGREKYIEALMKHYPVHSYGSCLRNMPGKDGFVSNEKLLELVMQYKFTFAWENANCKDYVTEKLERAFDAGALPIVDGPDDYSPFVPNNHSVLRVADFAGPKALADHLRRLEKDDELYLSYFDYKAPRSNYDPAFLAFDKLGNTDPEESLPRNGERPRRCEVCRRVVEELESGEGVKKTLQLDNSCQRRKWEREYFEDGSMAAEPTKVWIEEWGFGGEDLVLWAIGVGLILLVAVAYFKCKSRFR